MAKSSVVLEMDGDEKRIVRALARSEKEVDKLKGKLKEAGRAGKKAGKDVSGGFDKGTNAVASTALRLVSVSAALGLVNKAYTTWLANSREISKEAQKASNELITFAALQEGGAKRARVLQAAKLGAEFGIERGQAFSTIQSLQSVLGGDFQAGLKLGRTLFAAKQAGLPIETGAELEAAGISLGRKPGSTVRRAFAAGELSAKTPEQLARVTKALPFFEASEQGQNTAFAVATQLSGVFGEELATFTKAAGVALGGLASPKFKETLESLGVKDGTRLEKLRALVDAGIVTADQLGAAGLAETRQVAALANLLPNIANVERFFEEIPKRAQPGIFAEKRAGIEAEIPEAGVTRQIEGVKKAFLDEGAFGKNAVNILLEERERRIVGLTLRRLGIESTFGIVDAIDETGDTDPLTKFLVRLENILLKAADRRIGKGNVPDLSAEIEVTRRELGFGTKEEETALLLKQIEQNTRPDAQQSAAGTTLAKPDEDPP